MILSEPKAVNNNKNEINQELKVKLDKLTYQKKNLLWVCVILFFLLIIYIYFLDNNSINQPENLIYNAEKQNNNNDNFSNKEKEFEKVYVEFLHVDDDGNIIQKNNNQLDILENYTDEFGDIYELIKPSKNLTNL